MANKGLLTMSKFAMLGPTTDKFEDRIKVILPANALGADEPTQLLTLSFLGVVWQACHKAVEFQLGQRLRLEEDPHKIPEIAAPEIADMRERFKVSHPDITLKLWNEPHKKFVEIMNRDITVHGMVMFYELGQCRVRADKIIAKTGWSQTADEMLKVSKQYDPITISSDADVLNRIQAHFIALEYLGVCPYRSAGYTEECEDGCALSYWEKLMEQRQEFQTFTGMSPTQFTIIVDKMIRSKAADLMFTKRGKFPQFQLALGHVLHDHRHFWLDARNEAIGQSSAPATPIGREKRERSSSPPKDGSVEGKLKQFQDKKRARKNKQREKKLEKAGKGNDRQGTVTLVSNGRPPLVRARAGGASGPDQRQKVDGKVFSKCKDAIKKSGKKICPFWNLPCDCKFQDTCSLDHKCPECGVAHKWFENHH